MANGKKVLIAPLDWGLGHASRCIPIIRKELTAGSEVLLASNGRSAALLQQYFPALSLHTDIPDYAIRYSNRIPFTLKMMFALPSILQTIRQEHLWLRRLHATHGFDQIISDNRYGLHLPNVHSVILTHQTAPIVPYVARPFIFKEMRAWLEKFDETWIPDFEDITTSLAGQLSHNNLPVNARFIGPLSRFEKGASPERKYKKIGIVSGPEPHRTLLEEELVNEFKTCNDPCLVLSGRTEDRKWRQKGTVDITSFLEDRTLASLLMGAEEVVCRSGYTSIMDFHILQIRNIRYIPTPGQTEQEYLFQRQKELSRRLE